MKRRGGRFAVWVLASVSALLAVTSCGQTKRELKPDELEWECFDQEWLGCDCVASERASGAEPKAPPAQCSRDDCCLLDLEPEDGHVARCDCFPSEALCEDEKAKRPHVELVDRCPPSAEGTPAPLCAVEGEDCSRDYLIANGFDGCCDAACLPNDDGGRTCQHAGPLETLHSAYCSAGLERSTFLDPVITTLRTSVGTFEFDQVSVSSFGLGSGGCLNGLSVTLLGADEPCVLTLGASLVEGRLVLDTFQASFGGCDGYTGSNPDGSFEAVGETPFAIEVQGLSCESVASEETCFGGEFSFLLDGALRGDEALVFHQQIVLLAGAICGEPSGGCAEP